MVEFFQHCPSCGKRFHIKLEEKKMVHSESTTFRRTRAKYGGRAGTSPSPSAWGIAEGPPRTVQVKDFELHYKCEHCGHEWTEHQQKKYKER